MPVSEMIANPMLWAILAVAFGAAYVIWDAMLRSS